MFVGIESERACLAFKAPFYSTFGLSSEGFFWASDIGRCSLPALINSALLATSIGETCVQRFLSCIVYFGEENAAVEIVSK